MRLALFSSLPLIVALLAGGCKSGGDMKGGVQTRETTATDKEKGKSDDQKPDKDYDSIVAEEAPESEVVDVPGVITGAFLFCVSELKKEAVEAQSNCAYRSGTAPNNYRNVDLAATFSKHTWGFQNPTAAVISQTELPAGGAWQVAYKVVAASASELKEALDSVDFKLQTVTREGEVKDAEAKTQIIELEAPDDFTIRSVASPDRCLDVSGARAEVDVDILGYPCHGFSNQNWTLTSTLQLTTLNMCLGFKDGNVQAYVKNCQFPDAPAWQIVGNQIKLRGSSQCLQYKDGVTFLIPCNASDPTQLWLVGKKVLQSVTP